MKIGLVLVMSHQTHPDSDFINRMKSITNDTQLIVWNTRKNFAGFVSNSNTQYYTRLVLSSTTDHIDIAKRIKKMNFFRNRDVILIVNYGNVEIINNNNHSLSIIDKKSNSYSIISTNIPIFTNINVETILDRIFQLSQNGSHQECINTINTYHHLFQKSHYPYIWLSESISCFYTNEKERGINACVQLSNDETAPDWMKTNAFRNLSFYE